MRSHTAVVSEGNRPLGRAGRTSPDLKFPALASSFRTALRTRGQAHTRPADSPGPARGDFEIPRLLPGSAAGSAELPPTSNERCVREADGQALSGGDRGRVRAPRVPRS